MEVLCCGLLLFWLCNIDGVCIRSSTRRTQMHLAVAMFCCACCNGNHAIVYGKTHFN